VRGGRVDIISMMEDLSSRTYRMVGNVGLCARSDQPLDNRSASWEKEIFTGKIARFHVGSGDRGRKKFLVGAGYGSLPMTSRLKLEVPPWYEWPPPKWGS